MRTNSGKTQDRYLSPFGQAISCMARGTIPCGRRRAFWRSGLYGSAEECQKRLILLVPYKRTAHPLLVR